MARTLCGILPPFGSEGGSDSAPVPHGSHKVWEWPGMVWGLDRGARLRVLTAGARFLSVLGCHGVVRDGSVVGLCRTVFGPTWGLTPHAGERDAPSGLKRLAVINTASVLSICVQS